MAFTLGGAAMGLSAPVAAAQPTFAFFVGALGAATLLDPAASRVFARFLRSDSLTVSGTSVAVTTQ